MLECETKVHLRLTDKHHVANIEVTNVLRRLCTLTISRSSSQSEPKAFSQSTERFPHLECHTALFLCNHGCSDTSLPTRETLRTLTTIYNDGNIKVLGCFVCGQSNFPRHLRTHTRRWQLLVDSLCSVRCYQWHWPLRPDHTV